MSKTGRNTKIIATVGLPRDSRDYTFLEHTMQPVRATDQHGHLLDSFIAAGADVIRLNMSRTGLSEIYGWNESRYLQWLRDNREGIGRTVTVFGDLPGPSIRLAEVHTVGDDFLESGERILLNFGRSTMPAKAGNSARVTVNGEPFDSQVQGVNGYSDIGAYIRSSGGAIFPIGDGELSLRALSEESGIVYCEVITGGRIISGRALHLPAGRLKTRAFGPQDKRALEFLLDQGSDLLAYVAVSFVQSDEDILMAKDCISTWFAKTDKNIAERPLVLAKIETELAWANVDHILDVADGAIVARGNLAIQLPPEHVPRIQKELIRKCIIHDKPVMVATEVLDSMMGNIRPSRAEAADIFNAILDGCNGIVLSGETSVGRYPVEAIAMVDRVAKEAERFRSEAGTFDGSEAHFRMSGFPPHTGKKVLPMSQNSTTDNADGLSGSPFYSVFVSYGGPDEVFAERLSEALERSGVHTFLFARHAEPGKKLHRLMREGVNEYDRVVLVCSHSSLERPGVLNEIEETLQREAREGGESILIPVTLDGYVFEDWAPRRRDISIAVRDRVVADFRGADFSEEKFAYAMSRLVNALRRAE